MFYFQFKCDVCDLSFRKKQLLKRHKNIYHNPNYVPPTPKEKTLECSQCKKAFRYKGNLIRHMSYEHPEPASINTDSTIAVTIDPQTAAAPPRTSIPQTISRTRRVTRSASKTSGKRTKLIYASYDLCSLFYIYSCKIFLKDF